jgi:hypothetical protein
MCTKHAKNDTKVIKRDGVSSKNVKNQYDFVLPSLTSLLHTPRGASAKAVLWITWPQKARQTAPKMCFSENENATYVKSSPKSKVQNDKVQSPKRQGPKSKTTLATVARQGTGNLSDSAHADSFDTGAGEP